MCNQAELFGFNLWMLSSWVPLTRICRLLLRRLQGRRHRLNVLTGQGAVYKGFLVPFRRLVYVTLIFRDILPNSSPGSGMRFIRADA